MNLQKKNRNGFFIDFTGTATVDFPPHQHDDSTGHGALDIDWHRNIDGCLAAIFHEAFHRVIWKDDCRRFYNNMVII